MILSIQTGRAALATLAILQTVMLVALVTRTEPHPPLTIPLFAMGPFLGFALSLVAAAWALGLERRVGRAFAVAAAAAALISYGPQKWFDAAIAEIWPAVLAGQVAAATLLLGGALGWRRAAA